MKRQRGIEEEEEKGIGGEGRGETQSSLSGVKRPAKRDGE
jgi:hypothetical protein